jgi:hypothetical protein
LGESAAGGGCFALEQVDAAHLARAIGQWLSSPASLETARAEIRDRRFKSWPTYADELISWLSDLPRRS